MNQRELATVLAALRYWQREGLMSGGHEQDISTDGGKIEQLTTEEIDGLCERLNCEADGGNCRALLESIHDELEGMGFGTDQDIDGGDCCEYLGKLFVDVGEALKRDDADDSILRDELLAACRAAEDLLIRCDAEQVPSPSHPATDDEWDEVLALLKSVIAKA